MLPTLLIGEWKPEQEFWSQVWYRESSSEGKLLILREDWESRDG
jgi:hypothetical protein